MKQLAKLLFTPFRTIQFYACIGGIWLLVNIGIILANLVFENNIALTMQMNSIIFILVSSALLYYFINRKGTEGYSAGIRPIYRLLRALKAYNECHKALIRTSDEQQLMNDICRIFIEVGGYRMAWVGLAADDDNRTITPVAGWGNDQDFIEIFKTKCINKDLDKEPIKTVIRTGKPVVLVNQKLDPACEMCQIQFLRNEVCSSIFLPLSNHGKTFAAMTIYSAGKFAFDEEEVTLLTNLAADLSYGIAALRLNEENRAAEQQRQLLESVITQMSPGLLVLNHEGLIQYANPSAANIVGIPANKMIGNTCHSLICNDGGGSFCEAFTKAASTTKLNSVSFKYERHDGAVVDLDLLTWAVLAANAKEPLRVGILRDVTHETQLETQLRRAQRMEAIGILAGGIAHDFNNALASIITCTELALDGTEDSNLKELLEIVLRSGQRGKELVRQILTFSRQTDQERQEVRLDMIVKECLKLLRSTLTPSIEIRLNIEQELGMVFADPTQMHQIVMNLCTNAIHAMRGIGQGVLELSLENYDHGEDMGAYCINLTPGSRYLRMSVRDNGHGMDEATMERIFDPFFSTKGMTEGTGLGLSVIHGIISKLDGGITVNSAVGQGAKFDVYLPVLASRPNPEEYDLTDAKPTTGGERILLVDDDEDLLFSVTLMLHKLGYKVTSENDPLQALEHFRMAPHSFDLVITDQAMPNLNGIQLAAQLAALRPDLPIILCTGFDPTSNYGTDDTGQVAEFITELAIKPLERYELSQTVRRALDVASPSGDV